MTMNKYSENETLHTIESLLADLNAVCAEVQRLAAGGTVEAADFVSKKGKGFRCRVSFKETAPGEGKKIVPEFV